MLSARRISAILEAASLQIGPAIEAALKFQDVRSQRQPITSQAFRMRERSQFNLERELLRASRDDSRIGLLVCDLDGFKQVNDRFGHLTGDEVLRRVAKGLRETCRASDYLARMGEMSS